MCQHQVGNIGAGDQEDQPGGAEHQKERLAQIADQFVAEWHNPEAVARILTVRSHLDVVFLLHLARQRVHLRLGIGERDAVAQVRHNLEMAGVAIGIRGHG